jgi:hypothetical protein
MGWQEPYLGGTLENDLLRVISWINHLVVDVGVCRSTVSTYLTGVKQQLFMRLVESEALGEDGKRHRIVRSAVNSVRCSDRNRVPYRAEWIREGRRVWPFHVFIAIGSIFLLALRQGEFIGNYGGAPTKHLLFWTNIRFLKKFGVEDFIEMMDAEVLTLCADGVTVNFNSRKFQSRGIVREIPMPTRLSYPADGNPRIDVSDPDQEIDLCAVTLLQTWFIQCALVGIPLQDIPGQPVMQLEDGSLLGSRTVIESLRMISDRHGIPKSEVVIHSLKHGSLTALGEAGCSAVDIAMVGGHKSIESSQPYLHPGRAQGERVSQVLGRKRTHHTSV